jgi:hypothetical protein
MGKAALGRFQPMLFKPVVEVGLSGVVAPRDELAMQVEALDEWVSGKKSNAFRGHRPVQLCCPKATLDRQSHTRYAALQ